jgi:hypothetical protein
MYVCVSTFVGENPVLKAAARSVVVVLISGGLAGL